MLPSVTHQPQACCQIFDFLVDEAAELKLAFLAFDWLLIFRLCALHTDTRVKRNRAQNSQSACRSPIPSDLTMWHKHLNKSNEQDPGYVVSNSTPKYWSIKFFLVQAEAELLSESVCSLEDHISAWGTWLICHHIHILKLHTRVSVSVIKYRTGLTSMGVSDSSGSNFCWSTLIICSQHSLASWGRGQNKQTKNF